MNMMPGIMFCLFLKPIKQFLATLLETVVCLEMKEALRSVGQASAAGPCSCRLSLSIEWHLIQGPSSQNSGSAGSVEKKVLHFASYRIASGEKKKKKNTTKKEA